MIMSRELYRRFHADTGIVLNTLCPGCVADPRFTASGVYRSSLVRSGLEP